MSVYTFVKKSGAPAGAIHLAVGDNNYVIDDVSNTSIGTDDAVEASNLAASPYLVAFGVEGTYTPPPVVEPILSVDGQPSIVGPNETYIPVTIGTVGAPGPTGPTGPQGAPGVGASWQGLYNALHSYSVGDGVTGSDGRQFVSNVGTNVNNNPVTDSGTNWSPLGPLAGTMLSGGSSGPQTWAPTTSFVANQVVFNVGGVFVAKNTHTSGSSFSGVGPHWSLLSVASSMYPLGSDSDNNINIGSNMPNIVPGGTGVGAWGNVFLGGSTGGAGVGGVPGSLTVNGYGNVGIGNSAMGSVVGGFHNVALGNATLSYSQGGYQNTAIGEGALYRLDQSAQATFAGVWNNAATYASGHWVIDKNNNTWSSKADGNVGNDPSTVPGSAAWNAFIVGNNNVGVGGNAGQWLDTASANNTLIGSQAAGNSGVLSTASNNTGVGFSVLQNLTSGSTNVAVGTQALFNLSTGQQNIAIGHFALWTSNGKQSVAIGFAALQFNTADGNTGVGYNVLNANTTGTQNVALGGGSLSGNTTGASNTGLGYHALQAATSSFNTAVGALSLGVLTTATGTTAVGYSAGSSITTGISNSLFGRSAGSGITTGQLNVMMGYQAGVTNTSTNQITTGSFNTHIGYQSGPGTVNPSNSVAIGYQAFVGEKGTAIGRGAVATGTGSVAIGVDSGNFSASATSTNYFVLGTASHKLFIPGLPTADPHVVGQLWSNGGVVTVSAG